MYYDGDGKRYNSESGYEIIRVSDVEYYSGSNEQKPSGTVNGQIAINSNGRVKTSNGDIKIDGDTYTVKFATDGSTCTVTYKDK